MHGMKCNVKQFMKLKELASLDLAPLVVVL